MAENMATQLHHGHLWGQLRHLGPPLRHTAPPRGLPKLHIQAISSGGARKLIESGAVRAIPPKNAAAALVSEGYKLLDIRPEWEREKARVSGTLHVPLFVADTDNGPVTLLKKWVHFGYIGLWTGQNFTKLNDEFLRQVEAAVPDKETKLLVACGEGLRSEYSLSDELDDN